mmetsp:Transcript_158427/g.508189  ORF Transcript_158427/g.508189 Transcript_158427/m.508189 type:complete len:259 (-) Transcript_158427:898-1674(-)
MPELCLQQQCSDALPAHLIPELPGLLEVRRLARPSVSLLFDPCPPLLLLLLCLPDLLHQCPDVCDLVRVVVRPLHALQALAPCSELLLHGGDLPHGLREPHVPVPVVYGIARDHSLLRCRPAAISQDLQDAQKVVERPEFPSAQFRQHDMPVPSLEGGVLLQHMGHSALRGCSFTSKLEVNLLKARRLRHGGDTLSELGPPCTARLGGKGHQTSGDLRLRELDDKALLSITSHRHPQSCQSSKQHSAIAQLFARPALQ